MRIKPHCCLCMREMLPEDDIILTDYYYFIHECCEKKNRWGERDRGLFFEVAARNFPFSQSFVHDFNMMGYYNKD